MLPFCHGTPSLGRAYLSRPSQPAFLHASIKNNWSKRRTGLWPTVPASKKLRFINEPKNAAIPVNNPTMRPSPTRISPYVITYENNTALGMAKSVRNEAYQEETCGYCPVALAIAPVKNPFIAVPALSPTHAGLVNLAYPAVIQTYPTKKRTTSHSQATLVSANKNRESFGSGISIIFPITKY